jgi:gluconokinase
MAAVMTLSIVFMGVAGCGKSSLAATVAADRRLPLIEGDDFHSDASRRKMNRGVALSDADRVDWLATLAAQLRAHPHGVALTCSALRAAYRDGLREAATGLRFVFLDIGREEAGRRVGARASHFFSPDLVDSQFATLESPVGEAGVLRVDATLALDVLTCQVVDWLPAV